MYTMAQKPVTLYLDADEVQLLSKIAAKQDTSASRLIRLMIREYLKKNREDLKGVNRQ